MKLIFFILLSSSCLAEQTSSLRAIELNKQGIDFLKKQNTLAAKDRFINALAELPYSPSLQINLGLSFDQSGDVEKAIKAYEGALQQARTNEEKFIAHYNIAEIYGRQKKIDEALHYYQKALEFNPTSVETKTNIELLIQSQNQPQQGQGEGQQNQQQDQQQNQDNKDKEKKYSDNKQQPQPNKFKSEELRPEDVKKILQELDRQEQRVRAEYNRKQSKERTNDKDW